MELFLQGCSVGTVGLCAVNINERYYSNTNRGVGRLRGCFVTQWDLLLFYNFLRRLFCPILLIIQCMEGHEL